MWAAQENRTMLTHDFDTMINDAKQLLIRGEQLAGVIFVPDKLPIGRAIDNLQLFVECCSQSEMYNRLEHLPL
jgi:hypothetical protein